MNTLRFSMLTAVAGFLLVGCGDRDEELATASVTSALSTSRNAGMGRVVYEEPPPWGCLSPEDAAAEAAARPIAGLYPSECAVKTAEGSDLHVELAACTGPFGRVRLNGGLDAAFSAERCDVLHASITDSGDLTANDRALDYSASAEIHVDGDLRNVDWAGHWTTTTKRGREIEQTSDLSLVLDTKTSCLDVAGTTTGHVGEWEFDTALTDLTVCPDACPSKGKVDVHIDGWREKRLSIAFDGSTTATVTRTDGSTFEVDMVCSGDEE